MITSVETVTPSLAREFLERNTRNRKLVASTVEAYATDMKHGKWILTNQGIGFDKDGNLIDGQHRLAAVILANKPIEMLICSELGNGNNEAQMAVDTGKPRSIGDLLKLVYDIPNATTQAAIINNIINLIIRGNRRKLTANITWDLRKFYKNQIDLVLSNASHSSASRGLKHSTVLAVFVFAAVSFPDEVVAFERKYFSGELLSSNDPEMVLRNYMMARVSYGITGELTRQSMRNRAFTCLKYSLEGKKLYKLINSTGAMEWFIKEQITKVREVMRYLKMD